MTQNPLTLPANTYARIAGVIYLTIAVFGAFSIGYVPSVIVESADPAATAANLLNNPLLFNFGIIADIIVILAEIVLSVILYIIFKPVSPTLSLIAAFSRIAMVLIMGVNLWLHIVPVFLLSDATYLQAFDLVQRQAAAMALFEAHNTGIFIWQLFFSLHLVVLGYMIIKSQLFPRVLGWMMLIGAFGYLTQALANITQSDNGAVSIIYIGLLVLVTLGELAFAFWLLIKGQKSAV